MENRMKIAVKVVGVTRALVGFSYGAIIWHEMTKSDFTTSPFYSSFRAVVSGMLGLIAAEACALAAIKPLGDIVVILALSFSAVKKLGY